MAEPIIRLDAERASVQPGGQARIGITLTNTGSVVEGYWLQVLGPAAGWAEVIPPELSVYPQQEASAAVVFSPPSGTAALGGTYTFGVIARSTLDARVSAVAEGEVEVGHVYGLQAKIIPVTSAGRWRGRHVIQISNWGNAPAQLRMSASDPDEALGFYLSPVMVAIPPGGRATVRLSARARHPFLRGTPTRLPFQVVGERLDGAAGPVPPGLGYGDLSRPVADAAFNQKPILSTGVLTFAITLLAGIAALIGFLLLRPIQPEPLAGRGSPPRPELSVVSVGPDTVVLRWKAVDGAETYELQQLNPEASDVDAVTKLDGALNRHTVTPLKPETEVCFKLRVIRGGLTGPLTEPVCVKTAAAPATPTPLPPPSTPPPSTPPPSSTDKPSITPGDPNTDPVMKQRWIAVAEVLPKSSNIASSARAVVKTLKESGLDGKYLDSAVYPRLQLTGPTPPPAPPAEPVYLVFVGPFLTQAEAEAACPDLASATGNDCLVAQPDPPA